MSVKRHWVITCQHDQTPHHMSAMRPHPRVGSRVKPHTHTSSKKINTTCFLEHIISATCDRKADEPWFSLRLLPVNHQCQIQSQLLRSDSLNLCHFHWSLELYLIHRLYMMLHCPWLPSKSGSNSPAISETLAFLHFTHCAVHQSPILVVSYFA